jgi:hypothetical protein
MSNLNKKTSSREAKLLEFGHHVDMQERLVYECIKESN